MNIDQLLAEIKSKKKTPDQLLQEIKEINEGRKYGRKGKDADENAIVERVLSIVISKIPEPIKGEDGKDAVVDYDKIIKSVIKSIPKPKNGKNGKDAKIDYTTIFNKVKEEVSKIQIPEIDYERAAFETAGLFASGEVKLGSDSIYGLNDLIKKSEKQNIKFTQKEIEALRKEMPKLPTEYAQGSGQTFLKSMRDVDVSNVVDGDLLTYNVSTKKWETASRQAIEDVNWGEIGGSITDQTDLTTYIADQLATQDTLQEVTDNGATTDNTISLTDSANLYVDGNVGIGTDSPDYKLDVRGDFYLQTPSITGRETLAKFQISDAGGDVFGVSNGTSTNSNFAPTFYGYKESTYQAGSPNNYIYSLNFRGLVPTSQDQVNGLDFGIINFETYDIADSASDDPNNAPAFNPLANRRLLSFRNGSDYVLTLDPDNTLGLGNDGAQGKIITGGFTNQSGAFDMALGMKYDTSNITGLGFENGTATGQVRFMAESNDGAYTSMNAPGTSVTGSWLDMLRSNTHYLWTSGSRHLAIGTLQSGYDTVLGAGNIKAITIDGTDQRITVDKQITATSGSFPVIDTTRTTSAQGNGTFDDLTGVASGMRLVTEKTNAVANDGTGGGFVYGFKDTSSSIISNFARTYARRAGANNIGMFQIGTGTDGSEYFFNFWEDGDFEIEGSANATAFVTSGGTSTQFVKGDGSLDSSDYLLESEFVPAGSDTQIQFNNAGAFGASADFTWDDSGKVLDVNGDFSIVNGSGAVVMGNVTGNSRGTSAIDIQTEKTADTQVASGFLSIALGAQVTANNSAAIGMGYIVNSTGFASTAIGFSAGATNESALAIGRAASASGSASTAVGLNSTASGSTSFALGVGVSSTNTNSVSLGSSSTSSGQKAVVFGVDSLATKTQSFAFGNNTISAGTNATALGSDLFVVSDNHTIIGSDTNSLSINNSGISYNNQNPITGLHSTSNILATDITNLGPELVTNGTFTGSATGWTLGTNWSYSTNRANKANGASGTLSQSLSITAGKYYYVTFNLLRFSAGTLDVSLGGSSISQLNNFSNLNKTYVYTGIIKAVDTSDLIFTGDADSIIRLDDISVKEITDGRLETLGGATINSGQVDSDFSVSSQNVANALFVDASADTVKANTQFAQNTTTVSAVGPTDDLDVSNANIVFIDASSNNVTIGGLTGGVSGQIVQLVITGVSMGTTVTIEHNEGTGNQDIFLTTGGDETLTNKYGGWSLVCDGSHWYDAQH